MAAFFGRRTVRIAVLSVVVIWTLLTMNATAEKATAAAACLERAQFEQILCVAPPGGWTLPLVAAVIVGLSVVIGRELTRRN